MLVGNSAYIPPGSYVSIATGNGTGSSPTITLSSIPQTFKHLEIRTFATSSGNWAMMKINSDSGSNYTNHFFYGNGTTIAVSGYTSQTSLYGTRANIYASIKSVGIISILDYSSTTKYKTIRGVTGEDAGYEGFLVMSSGLWLNTSAITSIEFITQSGNWNSTNSFALYGIKESV
jgi:uncharacterized protein YegP (UPF0339 family)